MWAMTGEDVASSQPSATTPMDSVKVSSTSASDPTSLVTVVWGLTAGVPPEPSAKATPQPMMATAATQPAQMAATAFLLRGLRTNGSLVMDMTTSPTASSLQRSANASRVGTVPSAS